MMKLNRRRNQKACIEKGGMGVPPVSCSTKKHGRDAHATRDRSLALIEPLEDRLLMAVFTVTNTNDSGVGSLRWAISQTGTVAGLNTVAFNISSADKTIRPTSSFDLWSPAIIDATTQPGYAGKPLVTIDGSNAGNNDAFRLGGGCTLKGVDIVRFAGSGISCTTSTGAGGNTIQADWIGIDINGNAAANAGHGIGVYTPGNIIGGPSKSDGNLIANNGAYGIFILGGLFGNNASGNLVENNAIGVNVAGSAAMGNYNGVGVQSSPNNSILYNLISGSREIATDSGGDGILLSNGANGTIIRGNLIGTDSTGTAALTNQQYGIEVQTSGNTISGNTISGNSKAGLIFYGGGATGSTVTGNYIGTDSTGTKALGNLQQGVAFSSAGANQIGGTNPGDGNIIAANIGQGIAIFPGSGEVIQGNRIGIGAGGQHLGNQLEGIVGYGSSGTVIGGSTAASGNIIAYNVKDGIGSIDAGADRGNNQIFGNNGQVVVAPPAPQLQTAVSRRAHAGTVYDIPLPLTGTTGVECRIVSGGMTLVLTFDKPVSSATASITAGAGNVVGIPTASGNTLSINLGNVANAQALTLSLTNIVATDGGIAPSAAVTFRVLQGDVNGNGIVSTSDVNLVKYNVGKSLDATNFRMDLNANGLVSSSDVNLAKYYVGTVKTQAVATLAMTPFVAMATTTVTSSNDVLDRYRQVQLY